MPLDQPQPVCGLTAEDYAQVLADLLPLGAAWPREPATVLMRAIGGFAVEFSRVHSRDCDLLAEAYPGTANETIADWERVCGLPDPCTGPLETLQQRRNAVLGKLSMTGGQSVAYITQFLTTMGFFVEITEGPGPYAWEIFTSPTTYVYFRAGVSRAGDRLKTWGNKMLECAVEEIRPAHTVVTITYASPSIWDSGASAWDLGQSVWDAHARPPPGWVPPQEDEPT